MEIRNALGRRALRVALLALAAMMLLGTGSASARNIYVNDDRPATPPPSKCEDPEFNSIQAAVTAAMPGDRIYVCAGTYREQVTVTKRLALIGIGRPVINPPTPATVAPPGALVEFRGGASTVASITGFRIAGPLIGPANCATDFYGVYVHEAATATITHNEILDIRGEPLNGCQTGTAVQAGNFIGPENLDSTPGTVLLYENLIARYQKNGVTVNELGSRGHLEKNRIQGVGETPIIAQNGVQFGFGAVGSIEDNLITDNEYAFDTFDATGVLLTQPGERVRVEDNAILRNDVGVLAEGTRRATIEENIVRDSASDGIALAEAFDFGEPFGGGPTFDSKIEDNDVRRSGSDGLLATAGSVDNVFEDNTSLDNGEWDCRDENGDGPNRWEDNEGETSSPPTLCEEDDEHGHGHGGHGHGHGHHGDDDDDDDRGRGRYHRD
jgi:nitrous oxidase accessory protein NosD